MKRAVVKRDVLLSQGILLVGVVVYWIVCQPAIRREGDELDPFWLALRWLWPAPIVLSAWFDRLTGKRMLSLAAYVLLTVPPAAGASDVFTDQQTLDFGDMLPLAFPVLSLVNLWITACVEGLMQWVFGMFRAFPGPGGGAPADAAPTRTVRTAVCVALVLGAAVIFPFVYRQWVLRDVRDSGRRNAEAAWEQGRAVLYVITEDYADRAGDGHYEVREKDRALFEALESGWDPRTGLRVEEVFGGGITPWTYWRAYRNAILDMLAKHGPAPGHERLFTGAEMIDLLKSGRLQKVTRFPLLQGMASIDAWGRIEAGGRGADLGKQPRFIYAGQLHERSDVLVVASDQRVVTFSPQGEVLQVFNDPPFDLSALAELPGQDDQAK